MLESSDTVQYNMTTVPLTKLERILPLTQAAKRLGLSEGTLRELIGSGKVRAAVLPGGEIGVSEISAQQAAIYEKINERLRAVKRESFARLHRQPITMAEAIVKYKVPKTTLRTWIGQGYIAVLQSGYGSTFDEADVAFCAEVYRIRKEFGSLSGVPLLTDKGKPQEIKNTRLAEYRRRKKFAASGNGRH